MDTTATYSPNDSTPATLASFESFVDELIREKEMTDVSEEVHDQMKEDLIERVYDLVNARIIDQLSNDDLTEFEKLLDENAAEDQIQQFVENKVPQSATVIADALMDFRKTYLGEF